MSPDKDAKLRADYPLVFQQPLINGYPIQCGDGWYSLLDNLCRTLNTVIGQQPEETRWRYAARQVKEKFGTLRFYLEDDNPDSPVAHWIRVAEDASAHVCEVCGKDGTRTTAGDGGTRTRCDEHAKQRQWP